MGFKMNLNGEKQSEMVAFCFYKTERKTHPSFLRGWDISDLTL
jgi:hypothetical protein